MDTSARKLFLGPRLRRLRRELGVTQTQMAEELGVSPSYLNHLERNQRPLTAAVIVRLAETYDIDIRTFVADNEGADAADLAEILSDPMFRDLAISRHEVAEIAEIAPAVSDAIVRLYQALLERRRAPEAAQTDRPAGYSGTADEWVRDYVQTHRNHFPELDENAEALVAEGSEDIGAACLERLRARHAVTVRITPIDVMPDALRRYDHHRRRLLISELLSSSSRAFSIAYQLAALEQRAAVDDLIGKARPPDKPTERLLRVALLNYAAAAMVMPYGRFLAAAEALSYDVDRLGARFGASLEQVCHRLTTLGRPGARGVPFFMVRVDQAGNISKRFAATGFPFSRFGGACPRWALYASFRAPGRVVTQIIETVEGERFFTFSRTVQRIGAAGEGADLAIGMGCELKYAGKIFYARGLDLAAPLITPVGPACRLCERNACSQRAAAPLSRTLAVEEHTRALSPFPFSAA